MDNIEKELLESIIKQYETSDIQLGSMYILPDGRLLYLGNTGYGHSDLSSYLNEKGIEKDFELGRSSKFLRELGWIRINTQMKFIDLINIRPTAQQYVQLTKALDFMKDDIQVSVFKQFKIYKGRTSDEIIKLIKRFYSSGTLFESLK